jgi:hypothetical protein
MQVMSQGPKPKAFRFRSGPSPLPSSPFFSGGPQKSRPFLAPQKSQKIVQKLNSSLSPLSAT